MTKKKDESIWMSCRATEGCEGKKAKLVFKKKLGLKEGGGTVIRYRCLTCNGVWHIRL